MNQGYFEAILQLRTDKKEVEDFVWEKVKASRFNIVKRKKVQGGVDLYLDSWKFGNRLGNILVKQFGGSAAYSRKIFGMSRTKGVSLYRASILFRSSPYEVGSPLVVKGKMYTVSSISKKVWIQPISKGKIRELKVNDEVHVPKVIQATVSKLMPKTEVINLNDYQNLELIESDIKCKIGDIVSIACYEGTCHLISKMR